MAKLTKGQVTQLTQALNDLNRTEAFIKNEKTKVGVIYGLTSGDGYTNKDGQTIHEINKEIGSELCLLYRARVTLQAFINNNQ